MATTTKSLDLRKPAGGDTVNVATDLNNPYDVIDGMHLKGDDVASAAALAVGDEEAGNFRDVTGTVTVTSIATRNAGQVIYLQFDAALILTHNATSLILPTDANITTVAGDTAAFMSLGSGNWLCLWYQRQTGAPVALIVNADIAAGAAIAWSKMASRVGPKFQDPGSVAGTNANLAVNDGAWSIASLASTSVENHVYTTIHVPSDFASLTSIRYLVWSTSTANLRWSGLSRAGAVTQLQTAHTDSVAEATLALVANTITALDFTDAVSAIAAGDFIGLQMTRHGDDSLDTIATLYTIGVELEYVKA
jgi:hypothetical protein